MDAVTDSTQPKPEKPSLYVEGARAFDGDTLYELCEATEAAIHDGGGFGWVEVPTREQQERYWKGVLLVPNRSLFLGFFDGAVAGSVQLAHPAKQNEAQRLAAWITTTFVAPWARGHGLFRMLVERAEREARKRGVEVLNIDIRESQERAIVHFETLGFERWGTNPYYAKVRGQWVAGHYYSKHLIQK